MCTVAYMCVPLSPVRLALSRTRLLTRFCLFPFPQVLLQLACGAFPLDIALCDAINVPMDKLKWTSPFTSHRTSLGHLSHSGSQQGVSSHSFSYPARSPRTEASSFSQRDSGRGSESESLETPLATVSPGGVTKKMLDPESMVWATAVALAWLEHSSASYFIEWELVAAKASMWLSAQNIPEGRDLASIKAAANQLFIILRHWDENLQLNMLCYNPNSV
uniref:von Willebrand factor A domain containing 5B1 n=1 Tax=Myripristis murdjan TaxID=586833 RepID=A0A667YRY6_9TELE